MAEEHRFDVLLTGDQSLRYEQNISHRKIGVVSMSDNQWNIVKKYVPAIIEAVENVKHGEVLPVYCGKFIPRKFRMPGGP